jgi:outer membrane cobalamin receptor
MHTKLKLLTAAVLLANAPLLLAQEPAGETTDNQESAAAPSGVEEIAVVGKYIPQEKRSTASISNVLDAEMFDAAGDSSVAEGLKRVSGLNLQGGRFVYIRGLGERYSSTVLNGSTLPSPEPINRVVPLDLFPSGIIESVLVQKTFSAEYPAEFAGGTIQIRTKVVPEEPFLSISSGIGYAGNTTGKQGLAYKGGDEDWTGTDDGTRNIPPLLKDAIAGNRELRPNNIIFKNGFTPAELESIGESLSNNYTVRNEKIDPDANIAANFGTGFQTGNFRIGALGNLSYGNSWDTLEVSRNTYAADDSDELSTVNIQTWIATEQSVDSSMFLTTGVTYKDAHTLKGTVLQIHKMDDLAGKLTGLLSTENVMINQTRLEWIEQDLLSKQIDGEHYFANLHDLTINWHYNESRAKREAPDMREYRYDFDEDRGEFRFSLRGDANTRTWSDLEDQNEDIGIRAQMELDTPFNTSTKLLAGVTSAEKERDSAIRRFGFTGTPNGTFALLYRPTLDEIINDETIGERGFQLREATRPTDNYVATQDLDAWYAQADVELGFNYRLMVGVRGEESVQNVKTFDLFNKAAAPIVSNLESDDIFPVVTGTWILDQWDMQLRAGYSETISRPDFRELSPSPFTHPVTGYNIVGNPELTVAYIKNYDARWEWYYSADESVSIGLFYKEFDSPIEAVIKPGSAEERTFINAEEATTRGIEFDTYRWLGFIDERLDNFYAAANLTLIDSEVSIRQKDSGILTNPTRPLQGQADYIVNLQLGYDDSQKQKGSLVYHITGEKIREVGVLRAPDVIDEAYGELDLTYTRYWGDHLELNFKAKNLLNKMQKTTQGGLDVNSYREGTNASIGVTYIF